MKSRSMLLMLVAGGCGLVASVAVTQHLTGNQTEPATPAGEPVKRVVVATSDEPAGTQLKPDMLKVVQMPAKDLPEGTYSKEDEVTGETLRLPIFKGEMVLESKLGGEKSLAYLVRQLPPGMYPHKLRVLDDDAPVAGLINPGDYVDVWWRPGKTDVPGGVKTLMQRVKVLAVGQRVTPGDAETGTPNENKSKEQNYTLVVTADQQRRLAQANLTGKFVLVLRRQDDESLDPLDQDALDELIGLKAAPRPVVQEFHEPPAPPEPEKYEIEIIKGGQFSTEQFGKQQHGRIQGNR